MHNPLLLSLCCSWLLCAMALGKEPNDPEWRAVLGKSMPLFGHRNWIVVADSAYPAQSGQGIETIYAGGDHVAVVAEVLRALDASKHVRPIIHMDAELQSIDEKDAPGIGEVRRKLDELVKGRTVKTSLHEDIIHDLDKAGKLVRVLIIKTDLALPYTSVFFELDCGYWGPAQEKHLRETMKKAGDGK